MCSWHVGVTKGGGKAQLRPWVSGSGISHYRSPWTPQTAGGTLGSKSHEDCSRCGHDLTLTPPHTLSSFCLLLFVLLTCHLQHILARIKTRYNLNTFINYKNIITSSEFWCMCLLYLFVMCTKSLLKGNLKDISILHIYSKKSTEKRAHVVLLIFLLAGTLADTWTAVYLAITTAEQIRCSCAGQDKIIHSTESYYHCLTPFSCSLPHTQTCASLFHQNADH